jgi:DNA-directed RNA polymerase subunit K/omega
MDLGGFGAGVQQNVNVTADAGDDIDDLEIEEGDMYNDYEEEELEFYGDDIKQPLDEQKNITFLDDKQTLNILTLSEKTRIVGVRAEQLANGAIPLVKLSDVIPNKYNPNICYDIAEEELRQGVIPFIIGRRLTIDTNKDKAIKEYWTVDQLIDMNN